MNKKDIQLLGEAYTNIIHEKADSELASIISNYENKPLDFMDNVCVVYDLSHTLGRGPNHYNGVYYHAKPIGKNEWSLHQVVTDTLHGDEDEELEILDAAVKDSDLLLKKTESGYEVHGHEELLEPAAVIWPKHKKEYKVHKKAKTRTKGFEW